MGSHAIRKVRSIAADSRISVSLVFKILFSSTFNKRIVISLSHTVYLHNAKHFRTFLHTSASYCGAVSCGNSHKYKSSRWGAVGLESSV